jgi:hypothetical protein
MAEATFPLVSAGATSPVEEAGLVDGAGAAIGQITDGEDRALGRLILYFQRRPRIVSLLAGLSRRVQTLEDLAWDLYTLGWDPDDLSGVHLDSLGRLVGEGRLGRTDAQYRPGLKARQLVNSSDGSQADLSRIVLTLLPSAVLSVTDFAPAAVIVEVLADFTDVRISDLTRYLNQARAAGVRLGLVTADTTDALIWAAAADAGSADLDHGWGDVAGTVGGLWASGG